MDYVKYIDGSINLTTSHKVTAYFKNNTTKEIETDAIGFEELCYNVANAVNRDSNYDIFGLIGYSYYENQEAYFVGTNKSDFYWFSANASANFTISAVVSIDGEGYYGDLNDFNGVENYAQYGSVNAFSNGTYGTFYHNLQATGNKYVVFDYTSLHFDIGSYETEVLNVRGENVAFYNTYFYIENIYEHDLVINYGAPYRSMYQSGYSTGYGNGHATGWVEGNANGYQAGINSQGGTIQSQPATAFTYIEGAFNVAGSIMSLEVLPNITLGLVWSIPLVFVLIMTIFKLVRK